MKAEACIRHPDRSGEFGLTTHYVHNLGFMTWRDVLRIDQTFGPLCSECRSEFIYWVTQREEQS